MHQHCFEQTLELTVPHTFEWLAAGMTSRHDLRSWPKADVQIATLNVRF
jgi:hypothetical protein